MTWREYHELTKHSVESLRRTQRYLDWANMPNPFRHYEGVPILELPADPPAPPISALEVLEGKPGNTSAMDGAGFLSQLMFYSASISASKRVPSTGYTYALRVNPSSGNLHPTEFHFTTVVQIGDERIGCRCENRATLDGFSIRTPPLIPKSGEGKDLAFTNLKTVRLLH